MGRRKKEVKPFALIPYETGDGDRIARDLQKCTPMPRGHLQEDHELDVVEMLENQDLPVEEGDES